ncbi:MAG: UPF0175 family protein [Thermomicrobiales bacterium]
MTVITVHIEDDLAALIGQEDAPVEQTARELMVMELFRRGTISGGRAAELLRMDRLEFIHRAADVGIPYFNIAEQDLEDEIARLRAS